MAKIQSRQNSTKKETILEEAARLFYQRGFNAASMRDLAEKVGVEAASLYNHIHSKAQILKDICMKVAHEFNANIEKMEASREPVICKVEELLRFHIKMMIYSYEDVYVSDREWKHLAEPFLSDYRNQRRNYRKRFAAIIEAGVQNEEINNIDASTAVLIMLHAISGIESWHRSTQKISAELLEENMVTILVEGLRKR